MHRLKIANPDLDIVLNGGIGTLEEVVELISWRRLDLHAKPTVFYNPGGFWDPLFGFLDKTIALNLTPAAFAATWRAVDTVELLLPAIREMAAIAPETVPRLMPRVG